MFMVVNCLSLRVGVYARRVRSLFLFPFERQTGLNLGGNGVGYTRTMMIRLADNRSEIFISWFSFNADRTEYGKHLNKHHFLPQIVATRFSTRLPRQSIYTNNNMLCMFVLCIEMWQRETRTFNGSILHNSFLIVFIRIKGCFNGRLEIVLPQLAKCRWDFFCLFSCRRFRYESFERKRTSHEMLRFIASWAVKSHDGNGSLFLRDHNFKLLHWIFPERFKCGLGFFTTEKIFMA